MPGAVRFRSAAKSVFFVNDPVLHLQSQMAFAAAHNGQS
jgi:hypothetical protein